MYKRIQNAISALGDELHGLALDAATLAKPDAPNVSLLRVAVETGPGISGIRFTNNVIDGAVIDDAPSGNGGSNAPLSAGPPVWRPGEG